MSSHTFSKIIVQVLIISTDILSFRIKHFMLLSKGIRNYEGELSLW
jgi:hypothetical protein